MYQEFINIKQCTATYTFIKIVYCIYKSISNADTDGWITKANLFSYFISFFSLKKKKKKQNKTVANRGFPGGNGARAQ